MFKKNKQLIIGFLLGALIFGVIPVGATVQDYILQKSTHKIIVDGKEFSNKELPILIMEPGYNYIPAATFREISETMGIDFEFNGELGEIQINTKKNTSANEGSFEMENTEGIIQDIEEDIIVVDGVEYIALINIEKVTKKINRRYRVVPDRESASDKTDEGLLIKYTGDTISPNNYDVLIDKIPLTYIDVSTTDSYTPYHVEYQYFVSNILPLIKE